MTSKLDHSWPYLPPALRDVTGGAEKGLILVRVVMTVVYGHVLHSLRRRSGGALTPTQVANLETRSSQLVADVKHSISGQVAHEVAQISTALSGIVAHEVAQKTATIGENVAAQIAQLQTALTMRMLRKRSQAIRILLY